ncbi:hypothetical protein JKY72_02960 [Candidatus Gracilibacteria bacterium]|nr:hypothetical protein [Candidatus Gracilibacteria bacterium]
MTNSLEQFKEFDPTAEELEKTLRNLDPSVVDSLNSCADTSADLGERLAISAAVGKKLNDARNSTTQTP